LGLRIIAPTARIIPRIIWGENRAQVRSDPETGSPQPASSVLSGRTRGLVGALELAIMKPTARLVNTSRGPIVLEADLIAALKAQKIAGAAIDVFDQEPLPLDHPFRTLANLLATPHIGYVSRGLYGRFYQDTVENIRRWLDGQAAG